MKKILIDVEIHQAGLERLKELQDVEVECVAPALEVRVLPTKLIADAHLLFCTFPPSNLAEMKHLEVIQIGSVGYEQLSGLGLPQKNIRACNARGAFDPTIAEWNMAMMINLLRDLRGMIRNQGLGIWDRDARFQSELRGLTVGIWGYGGIGRATARLAKAFGMKIHVLTRNGVRPRENTYLVPGTGDPQGEIPDQIFSYDEKDEFLASLDFLILAVPQTPQTEGIVGQTELQMLKSSAFVLNPARGPLIQEAALLQALRENWIAGAALDTHYHYPMPADHPLWRFPNVIMTPHISGSGESPHYLERVWNIFITNVDRHLNGEPLLNELEPSQLETV
ncbi:MAG: D-2-hydroxyacid dehydrogenase [Abditibacteriaceae bacterium]